MLRVLSTTALAVLWIGCQDVSDISGFYVLTRVDSLEVPRVVSATVFCDELVLSGGLHLTGAGSFDLSVVQAQDCSRNGASVDTVQTTTSGTFFVDRNQLALRPAGTGIQLTGTTSGGVIDIELPQLPLLGGGSHAGTFIIFPR